MKARAERDSLGPLHVPAEAYYGAFTVRAREQFRLSGQRTHPALIRGLLMIKAATAEANARLGALDRKKADAVLKAAAEALAGKFDDQFVLDPLQAGAGTPVNMNVNEVLANRATELLGGRKGQYLVNPNDDVNKGQSSNSVVPAAIRLACLDLLARLEQGLEGLEQGLEDKAAVFSGIVKVGRTHLQDAVPVTLGQEFHAYAEAVRRGWKRIAAAKAGLLEMNIAGTAAGTGIAAHPRLQETVVRLLKGRTRLPLFPTREPVHLTQFMGAFVELADALEALCISLIKICNDLMLLNSGPRAGLAEIALPEVEPGSSIMPGKVNPSIAEAFKMACLQVRGNCAVVRDAAMEGQLELNVMTPVIAKNLFEGIGLLERGAKMFSGQCVRGIRANRERIAELLNQSAAAATALNPHLGYRKVAEIVKEANRTGRSVEEIVLRERLMDRKKLRKLLDPKRLTGP